MLCLAKRGGGIHTPEGLNPHGFPKSFLTGNRYKGKSAGGGEEAEGISFYKMGEIDLHCTVIKNNCQRSIN